LLALVEAGKFATEVDHQASPRERSFSATVARALAANLRG